MFQLIFPERTYTESEILSSSDPSPIIRLAQNWLNGDDQFNFNTSGSTGKPSEIWLKRDAIEASALNTIQYFNLQPGTKAALCLSPETTGGKMMIFRAIIGGWNLTITRPEMDPLSVLQGKFDFISLVPSQLKSIITRHTIEEIEQHLNTVLLGGSPSDRQLEQLVSKLKIPVHHGYGMTETASHIAIRKLNGENKSEYYTILPGIECKTDKDSRLMVKGSVTSHDWIYTTDVVELKRNELRWIGRSDFVINSGGYKIHPEEVESVISGIFSDLNIKNAFIAGGIPDKKWGEKLILVSEGQIDLSLETLVEQLKTKLPSHKIPKLIIPVDRFIKTQNGKPNRLKILQQAAQKNSKN